MRDDIVACSDKCVYLPSEECLVLSDLHLGAVNPNTPYPEMEHEKIDNRIVKALREYNPSTLVFNGDVFSNTEPDDRAVTMMESYDEIVENIVFTLGNHEENKGGFPDFIRNEYEVCRNKKIGKFLIHHGHHTPPKKADVHIIGHAHLQDDGHDALIFGKKCYYNSDVVVLPKFTDYVGGKNIPNANTKGHCPMISDGRDLTAYQIVKTY